MNGNVPTVDQSDRVVPVNLRQSGPTPVEMLIDTRVRKSPYWELSMRAGCWRASVYNRMYHPRGYVPRDQGGMMAEYESLVNDVTLWNVAVDGLMEARVGGHPVIVSQTGFTGEKGYEIYLRDATLHAEDMWDAVLAAGRPYRLRVVAPSHHRRIAAGILSWGQDMDTETLPFQVNLGYQVPRLKEADYIGRARLEAVREQIETGAPPFRLQLVGLLTGGRPVTDYAPDFWLVSASRNGEPVGYVTSPWFSPELGSNIAMAFVPVGATAVGTEYWVHLPDEYAPSPGEPASAQVVAMPFRPSVNPNRRERLKQRGLDAAV